MLSYHLGIDALLNVGQIDKAKFDSSLVLWAAEIGKKLPFAVNLTLSYNDKLSELAHYLAGFAQDNRAEHRLLFLLVRNNGKYPVKSIVVGFKDSGVVRKRKLLDRRPRSNPWP